MEKLTPILPCRTRDDVSEVRSAAQAEELLAAYTALWHPALVAAAGAMPKWSPAATPPEEPAGHLLLIPPTAEPLLPEDWLSHVEQLGAKIVRGARSRAEMIAAALKMLDAPTEVDADLAADFLALGYCHYVIQTITVSIRYMNSIDESGFERELVAAAVAACAGQTDEARAKLQAAFDLLHTAREYYYSSESYLVDLTLVAGSTIGESLRKQLSERGEDALPCNLLLPAQLLDDMAAREPSTLELLSQGVKDGAVQLVGGEYRELELPLLPIESIRAELVKGLRTYQEHLRARPTVFGRRRFGMTPVLPQILECFGFSAAIHATLDDGTYPTAGASRQRWEGLDGTTIEALLRVPCDATQANGFVRLPHAISGAVDMDNQPTAVFAHWPGRTSCWYEDIRRIRRYTAVLGTFRTLSEYFDHTGSSGHQIEFKADEYRSPYLAQAAAAGERDPISRWARYYASRASAEAAETLAAMAQYVSGTLRVPLENGTRSVPDTMRDEQISAAMESAAGEFTAAVGGQAGKLGTLRPRGIVVFNPLGFSRRACVDTSALETLPEVKGAVLHTGDQNGRKLALVEVPPLGFATLRPGSDAPAAAPPRRGFGFFRKSSTSRAIAERNAKEGGATLRNEFFELAIDPHTGAIRAIYDYRSRGPRLAQQLAMHLREGDDDEAYTIMATDEIRVVEAGTVVGEVAVRGRLVDRGGAIVARFQQTTRVTWGSRVIEVEVEIDPIRSPSNDPWSGYYAARFAWADDAPSLYYAVNQATVASEAVRLESPQFVEIRGHSGRTTLLAGGLPYHRRCGPRKLDTLLIVHGETARRFRFGIGIDLPSPQVAALDFVAPAPVIPVSALPRNDSAWLYHLDSRDVIATHWAPIIAEGAIAGMRVRLLETEERHVNLGLRCFRDVRSAQKLGGADRAPIDLDVAGDRVTVPLRPYEWAEVEVR